MIRRFWRWLTGKDEPVSMINNLVQLKTDNKKEEKNGT